MPGSPDDLDQANPHQTHQSPPRPGLQRVPVRAPRLDRTGRIVGCSLDTISAKYGVSRDSVFRHMRAHVSEDLRAEYLAAVPLAELAQKAASEGLSVLQYLSIVRSTLMNAFQLAANVGDRNGTAILAGRLNETLRTIGQLCGELGDMARITINGNVNVMNHPQIAGLQASILKALGPFPAAREAVVMALRAIDTESAPAATAVPEMKAIEHHAAT
jgi:hypothetical protein